MPIKLEIINATDGSYQYEKGILNIFKNNVWI